MGGAYWTTRVPLHPPSTWLGGNSLTRLPCRADGKGFWKILKRRTLDQNLQHRLKKEMDTGAGEFVALETAPPIKPRPHNARRDIAKKIVRERWCGDWMARGYVEPDVQRLRERKARPIRTCGRLSGGRFPAKADEVHHHRP